MKYRDFKNELYEFGCRFYRHGANHDIWVAPNGKRFALPRHAGEVPNETVKKIRKEVGII